jgi:undecaprenyl-diphosphatase
MNLIYATAAGAIQGLTEFLPVSSTGHLIIFQKLFHLSDAEFGLAFDASLHLGTLLAVGIFFFKDYLKVLDFKNKLYVKLALGTIPAAILGLLFEKKIESSVRELWIIGIALIAFSLVMIFAEKISSKNKLDQKIDNKKSFIIGLAQAIALIPGISRSGSTISAGLFLGLTREESARFAFMLSGPIIAGAGLKKFIEVLTSQALSSQDLTFFITGIISSFAFGYLTIKYFLKYLTSNNLYPFIVYRIILGVLLLLSPFLLSRI